MTGPRSAWSNVMCQVDPGAFAPNISPGQFLAADLQPVAGAQPAHGVAGRGDRVEHRDVAHQVGRVAGEGGVRGAVVVGHVGGTGLARRLAAAQAAEVRPPCRWSGRPAGCSSRRRRRRRIAPGGSSPRAPTGSCRALLTILPIAIGAQYVPAGRDGGVRGRHGQRRDVDRAQGEGREIVAGGTFCSVPAEQRRSVGPSHSQVDGGVDDVAQADLLLELGVEHVDRLRRPGVERVGRGGLRSFRVRHVVSRPAWPW